MPFTVFTDEELDELIVAGKKAYKAVLGGKNYSVNSGGSLRTLTRQDLPELREELYLLGQEKASRKGEPFDNVRFATFIDE